MRRAAPLSWPMVLLAASVALMAAPARAQETPPPEPAPQEPPPAVPVAPPAVPVAPEAAPVPYTAPPPFARVPYTPPASPPPDRESGAPMNWYGWQTLIAVAPFDIATFVGMARFGTTGATETLTTGFAGRNLVPAVVHLAHRRWSTALGSVGLHAGMTAAGAAIGYGIGLALQSDCPLRAACRNGFRGVPTGPGYGAVAGSMSATVLDVVFFSYRQRLTWTAAAPAAPTRVAWAMAPYAAPRGAGIAAAGTF